jgi:hypothetical protein
LPIVGRDFVKSDFQLPVVDAVNRKRASARRVEHDEAFAGCEQAWVGGRDAEGKLACASERLPESIRDVAVERDSVSRVALFRPFDVDGVVVSVDFHAGNRGRDRDLRRHRTFLNRVDC